LSKVGEIVEEDGKRYRITDITTVTYGNGVTVTVETKELI